MSNASAIFLLIIGVLIISLYLVTSYFRNKKKSEKINYFESKLEELKTDGYSINRKYINHSGDLLLAVDEDKKEIIACKINKEIKKFSFSSIIDCTIDINGQTIPKSSAAGIIGGAVIAGGIGAVIGASMKKSTKKIMYTGLSILFNNLKTPKLDFCFAKNNHVACLNSQSELENWHGVFKIIIERNGKNVRVAETI